MKRLKITSTISLILSLLFSLIQPAIPLSASDNSDPISQNGPLFALDWWNTNWSRRSQLTFNTTGIGSNLTGFPVLVHLTPSKFLFSAAQKDGGDLRFISSDNATILDFEIEKWTRNEAWVWVRIPLLRANSTTGCIWMYYGNPAAANGWNPQAVWDSNHKLVQHLEETEIDGNIGDINDTTAFGNNGTTYSMNLSSSAKGKVDGAFQFDGVGDHIGIPDNSAWAFGNFTMSMWVNANSWSGNWWTRAFIAQDEGGGYKNKWIFAYGGTSTIFHINTPGGGPTIGGSAWTALPDTWYYLAITRSGNTYTFYRNGVPDGTATSNFTIPNAAAPLTIGRGEGIGGFNGVIDEVRISNSARSADWMKASYLSDTEALITFVVPGKLPTR